MRKFRKVPSILAAVLLCLSVFLSGCGQKDLPTNSIPAGEAENTLSTLGIPPIELPALAGEGSVSSYTVSCSKSALAKANTIKSATVHYEPVGIPLETLMKNLNIPLSSAKVGSTSTDYSNDLYDLDVFKNGNFGLILKNEDNGVKKANLSNAEALKIAEDFLRKNDLYCDDLEPNETIGEDKAVSEKETLVTGKTVHFHPKTDRNATIFGNSHVTIHISADKQVTSVYYNHVHYAKTATLPLISAEEALEFAKTSKNPTLVMLETGDQVGRELKISKVDVYYYENVMRDTPSRQPVYVFRGGKGEAGFSIAVPALRS